MKAVAVIDKNRAIGFNGCLLCRLPNDLIHFKNLTLGKTMIIGRKTLDSFPEKKPLPGRNTVVLSRSAKLGTFYDDGKFQGFFLSSPEQVCAYIEKNLIDEETIVAGGAEIYAIFIDHCKELILTELDCEFEDADAFFPEFKSKFTLAQQGEVIEENGYKYRINSYQRV
ncbi:MAG: dihydrofolate reductase [Clostridia bacterium]|nr:dihydrofolate reductase [Clostridia bacterium]